MVPISSGPNQVHSVLDPAAVAERRHIQDSKGNWLEVSFDGQILSTAVFVKIQSHTIQDIVDVLN